MDGGPKMLVHIGYFKTGSTWLQKRIFPCEALGFCSLWRDRAVPFRELIAPLSYNFDREYARSVMLPDVEKIQAQGLVPVLSDENLCGNPSPWGYEGGPIARRLYSVFPDARVLICIREQRAMLLSLYRQSVRWGYASSLQAFFDRIQNDSKLKRKEPGSFIPLGLHFLKYDALVRFYIELFGAENVLVLPYELLRDNQAAFVNRILRHSGLQAVAQLERSRDNVSESIPALSFRRRLNWLTNYFGGTSNLGRRTLVQMAEQLDRCIPGKVRKDTYESALSLATHYFPERFCESNRRLQQYMDTDLVRYRYQV
jgi:hypothetical protein